MYNYILAIDPSGNFNEGKGTTGWVLLHKGKLKEVGTISAKDYKTAEAYWDAHVKLITKLNKKHANMTVVIEDYILYKNRAYNQINSRLETPRLIGVILHTCYNLNQSYVLQLAAAVKHRWSDEVLIKSKIMKRKNHEHIDSGIQLEPVHIRDAFRHAMHFETLYNKPKKKTVKKVSHAKSNYKS